MCTDYNIPTGQPFDSNMGGITLSCYWNSYPLFTDTNNLSLVAFIKYKNFKIVFPGDLEKEGWKALLLRSDFLTELKDTNILVASHHGRENGFCAEVFDHFQPNAVVISDKPIEHETQETVPDYRNVVKVGGVRVRNTGKTRHVLTTRRDGWIQFVVEDNQFYIDTEKNG